MAPRDGITVGEFIRLMKDNAPKSYYVRALSHSEVFEYLEGCVDRGLMTRVVQRDGSRRYAATDRLVDAVQVLR
jgi:hypothetical protein